MPQNDAKAPTALVQIHVANRPLNSIETVAEAKLFRNQRFTNRISVETYSKGEMSCSN